MQRRRLTILTLLSLCCIAPPDLAADDTSPLAAGLATLQLIGKEGQGHPAAVPAWQTVSRAPADQIPHILASMNDKNPLANNWIRAAVDTIAERTLAAGQSLPVDELETYLATRSHSPRSRRLAFEWLTHVDATARDRWIPKLLNDPSLELRREAVAARLRSAEEALQANQKSAAIDDYRLALTHARDVDQVDAAADALRKLDQPVDLARHFGFVTHWHLIGPFDNTDKSGFDRTYPPEETLDLEAEYRGKDQVVRWQPSHTEDPYGLVDLNAELGKHKGAAAYALAYFESDANRRVDLRLGCINANKIWLNGKLITQNHVYHSGRGIDQYVGQGQLQTGQNTILLKICQNEQTESWAQDWQFQLRVCDELGTAVLPSKQTEAR